MFVEEKREEEKTKEEEDNEGKRERVGERRRDERREGEEREKPPSSRAEVQHASVCTFKTSPSVPTTRPHVFNVRAFSVTHISVFNVYTETF